jgi:chemotaxis protein MotB
MGVGWRLAGMAALCAATIGGEGCVSLGTYEEQNRKIEALTAAYSGADNAVGQAKKENERLRLENEALKKQLAAADQRAANANAVVEAKYRSLQEEYQKLLEQLKQGPGGSEIEINRKTNGLVLSDEIFFQPGKAELRGEKTPILDKLIAKLRSEEFARAQIEIAGHTDSDPIKRSGWKDNYQLSCERARNVLLYFAQKGIPEERLHIAGYGASRPRSDKKSENRRVEVVLFEG